MILMFFWVVLFENERVDDSECGSYFLIFVSLLVLLEFCYKLSLLYADLYFERTERIVGKVTKYSRSYYEIDVKGITLGSIDFDLENSDDSFFERMESEKVYEVEYFKNSKIIIGFVSK